jgi:hypothetical protein
MIKAQPVSIRDGDQKKIEKDFQSGKVSQETSSDKAMIDPAKDLHLPNTAKGAFDHRLHLASMMPFSFAALLSTILISRQGKVEKGVIWR